MLEENKNKSSESNNKDLHTDINSISAWSFEHDELLSNWSDKAACYTWMHDATQRKFRKINMRLGIPVIVLSTISGTANFGISTIFPVGFSYGNAVIGTLSLITGVISTISNFLGYAQSEEAHRIACVQWSKFKRTLETELSLHPNERKNPSEFIKYAKAELDRLMEQSPTIPQDIIDNFLKTFRKLKGVKMPEICNKLEHTTIYEQLYNNRNNNIDNKINSLLSNSIDNDKNKSETTKDIINTVTNKVNNYMTNSSPIILKSENENENKNKLRIEENDEVILTIKDPLETVIYSNDDTHTPLPNIMDNQNENKSEEKTEENHEETQIEIKPEVVVPVERKRVLNKQLLYGRK